jgi:hypothetical protein
MQAGFCGIKWLRSLTPAKVDFVYIHFMRCFGNKGVWKGAGGLNGIEMAFWSY